MGAYTNIDDPSAHFQIATWTGDGSTSDRNIINEVDFVDYQEKYINALRK